MSGTKPTKHEEAGETPPPESDTKQGSEQDNFETIDPHDADEEFEIIPDAKNLPDTQDLDAVGKPFAGARAAEDAAKDEGGKQSQAGKKAYEGGYWSKEGDRSASGAKK